MSVFIVMLGEDHEGGSVVAAAASLEGARRAALECMEDHWRSGEWATTPLWGDELSSWQQGCDWMTIRKHIVLD